MVKIVQGLLAVLKEEDPWVRLDAAKVLVNLGNLSKVVQTLQALLDDEDSKVCEEAAKVLELQSLPFDSQN
ncbi:HEAT repeat domain-containing protein [Nostoc sp. FACHB-280]|uniref:HEAT repeat domain-containing protein n=1 Tax=Nostoc sp. FACHB-280 TaxID=2692839 RepID=UPI00168B78D4|nr:HEAT repeat domain-containing protein [Nostoc sp. FACHB-280]